MYRFNKSKQKVFAAARDYGISSVLFRNAIARKLGLGAADAACLQLLSIQRTSTPTELAKFTGLTSGSATAMLDRLEKAHYLKRVPNPHDRRGVLIEIDDRYQKAIGPIVKELQAAHAVLLERYSDAELQTISDFLAHYTNNVQAATKKIGPKKK